MTRETIVSLGFASSREQADSVATLLEQHSGLPFRGVNFSTAISNPEAFGEHIHDRDVVAHSAGEYAVKLATEYGALPRSATFIAPPIPERVRRLVWRGALIGYDDPATRFDMDEKITNFSAKTEIKRHPILNFGAIAKLGHFASLDYALELQKSGVPVTIGFMEHDGLFNLSTIDPDAITALRGAGVVVKQIRGTHTRFTANPVNTMNEIAMAPELVAPISTLDPTLSFRGTVLPHLGAFAARLKSAA